jgi:competence protein ComEA
VEPHPLRPAPARSLLDRLRAWVTWFGAARLIAAGASVILVAGAAFWLLRSPQPSTESQLPYAPGATAAHPAGATASNSTSTLPASTRAGATAVSGTTVAADVVVDVAGGVAKPGVYRLPPGARAVDAIAAAGGLRADADPNGVNLAAVARDGSRIYVPIAGEPVPVIDGGGSAPAETATSLPSGPIDLNDATVTELDQLPGVGPATAAAIVAYREAHGPFGTVDDLGDVRGIGPAKLDALRGLVTV